MSKLWFSLCLLSLALLVQLSEAGPKPGEGKEGKEILQKGHRKPKEGYKVKEKDLKQNKQKWVQIQHNHQHQQQEEWTDDMMQHPIDEAPRRSDRESGEMCTYSRDCQSGCCLLDRETKIRSCQPKTVKGEKCSAAQIKADLFVDFCPCEAGIDFCKFPEEYCTK